MSKKTNQSEPKNKTEARKQLNDLLSNAFDTIVLKRPEAVQAVVIAEHPARGKRPKDTPPKSYLVACFMERTREEDALDAILTDSGYGYWEFDYQDGPVATIQLKTTTKNEYNIKGSLKIHFRGYDFTFNNGGTGDSYKATISDSFKRCCGDAGFTRKFWQQQRTWVKYTPEVGKLFQYGNPTLKELGADISKEKLFLDKSPHLKTLSLEEFLALEEPKEIPETMMIENGKKTQDLVVARYFTKEELKKFEEEGTDEEIIRTELEHRNHFVFAYRPKSALIFNQLSKMKEKINDKQWEEWKKTAKKSGFKDEDADRQLEIISFFKFEIDDPKEVLDKKQK
ncbi:MAG: hypothetical protein P8Z50_02380, partial [candidate division WOR-3 bacterium]